MPFGALDPRRHWCGLERWRSKAASARSSVPAFPLLLFVSQPQAATMCFLQILFAPLTSLFGSSKQTFSVYRSARWTKKSAALDRATALSHQLLEPEDLGRPELVNDSYHQCRVGCAGVHGRPRPRTGRLGLTSSEKQMFECRLATRLSVWTLDWLLECIPSASICVCNVTWSVSLFGKTLPTS